jgi:urease accessory protein UreH
MIVEFYANANFKSQLELLLKSQSVEMIIDEQIVFGYMQNNEMATWSLLLMAGYLKVT